MSRRTLFLNNELYEYLTATSVAQTDDQRALADATAAVPGAGMESSPEQVQLLQLLVRLTVARRCLEVGVFTGCATLGIALALPPDGSVVACDIDADATAVASEHWARAGVAAKIDLRVAPALRTLDLLLAEGREESFDLVYIDADKRNQHAYYERALRLVRPNGLIVVDNVFWGGRVADPAADDGDTCAVREMNARMSADPRVEVCLVPLGDGLALARKREQPRRSPAGPSRDPAAHREMVELPIADPDQCAAVCQELYAQRSRWRGHRLNDQPPFYTLGTASYLTLGFEGRSVEEYLEGAGLPTEWASAAVTEVFERVRTALAEHLRCPVEYPATLPAPGFHIFVGAGIPRNDCAADREDCASCHFDRQHTLVPWDRWFDDVDLEDTISFTLPLALPAVGGGLTVWESLTLPRVRAAFTEDPTLDLPALAHVTPSETFSYKIGKLVLHSGHVLHQIAGVSRISVKDERITLQGHGVRADGSWRLYW